MIKEKTAKAIRIVTIPPILVGILTVLLINIRPGLFRSPADIVLCLICLAIIPVLAYPLQPLLPSFRGKGREGQRRLAFILSFSGYAAGVIIGLISGVSAELQFIFNTYLVSVLILIIFNKLLHLRASGHACSITGALLFLIFFAGPAAVIPCIIIFILIIWSSLVLKRHTPLDLTLGSLVCAISFFINYLFLLY